MYRTKSQLIGNVSTGASFAGIITASGLSVDTVNISGVSTVANVTFSSGIITATSGVVTYYGDGSGLTGISAGSTVFDDTTTNATFYPVFIGSTSGLISTSRVSTTKLTFNPSTSTLQVGTGITLSGSDGSISISGTVFASSLNIPIQISSFSPANGGTGGVAGNVVITFNQTVGIGTTGFIEVFVGASRSEFIGAGSTRAFMTNGGTKLNIDPTNNFPGLSTVRIVMSSGFITANGTNFTGINTSTAVGVGTTYTFSVTPALGSSYLGGRFICQSGGVNWILAPGSTDVKRSWYCRNDAVTLAQAQAACGDWFVPCHPTVQNPGFACRTYWDVICGIGSKTYVTSHDGGPNTCFVMMTHGQLAIGSKCLAHFNVRAFRCVTY